MIKLLGQLSYYNEANIKTITENTNPFNFNTVNLKLSIIYHNINLY